MINNLRNRDLHFPSAAGSSFHKRLTLPFTALTCLTFANINTSYIYNAWDSMGWFHPVQHTDKWRVLVNTVMNTKVPQNAENFLTN